MLDSFTVPSSAFAQRSVAEIIERAPGRIIGVQQKTRVSVRLPSETPKGREVIMELIGATTLESPRRALDMLDAAIRALYIRLRHYAEAAERDPDARAKHEATLAQLRSFRSREADALVSLLDRDLDWRPGEGYEAIERADALIDKYAHLATTDSPAEDAGA